MIVVTAALLALTATTPAYPPPTTPSPPAPAAVPAAAAPAPWAELDWQRGPDAERCISRDELARHTEAVLQHPVFSGQGPAAVRVRGGIGRDARGRWAATLALETADGRPLGTRELTSDGSDCRALDESVSVVLSLMVDVDRARLEMAMRPLAAPPAPPRAPGPAAVVVAA